MRLGIGVAAAALLAIPAAPAGAATITPNILTDENTSNANCSLREAVTAANTTGSHNGCVAAGMADDGPDTITLQSGQTYSLSLVGVDDANLSGDLDVLLEPLTVLTSGAAQATIDANGDGVGDPVAATGDRVFDLDPPFMGGVTTVSLQNLVLTDGSDDDGGGGAAVRQGGGVASLSVSGSRLTGNRAPTSGGGALRLGGSATITETSIDGNTADFAGGIYQEVSSLNIDASTISGNVATSASGVGGGIVKTNSGFLTLSNSTVSGNSSKADGGGVYNSAGSLNLRNVTIAHNTADSDAGGAGAGDGGGVFDSGGIASYRNSLIANNVDASTTGNVHPDCSAPIMSGEGYNLVENTTGCTLAGNITGNITGTDPGLLPLAANGGVGMTHALDGPTSVAINAGNPTTPGDFGTDFSACLLTDQRNIARGGTAGRCDIGAFELPELAPVLAAVGNKTVQAGQPLAFQLSATDVNPGDMVTFSGTSLPMGATVSPAGAFAWTPTTAQAGAHPGVMLNATDSILTDSETIAITVTAVPSGGGGTVTPVTPPKKCKKGRKLKKGKCVKKKKKK